MAREATVTIENARVRFLNFEGREGQFNRAGDRNFVVFLDKDVADQLARDGWNVKVKPPRTEEEDETYALSVTVGFKGRPPRLVMIGAVSGRRTELTEDTCALLDHADLVTVDLIIRPYDWEVNRNTGRKAYLKTGFFTIEEDYLELKYATMESEPV